MIHMKGLLIIAYLLANLVPIGSKCPPQSISPCVCYTMTKNIHCTGLNVTYLPLHSLDDSEFGILYVNDTSITNITNDSLGNSKWDKIYIHNNRRLRSVASNAFRLGPTQTLWVANNTDIDEDELLGAIRELQNTENIILDGNDIDHIPSQMFHNKSRVKFVDFEYNVIKSVSSRAFFGAQHLEYVSLDRNHISRIDNNGLEFTASSDGKRTVTVLLRDNNLIAASFNSTTFDKTNENITIELHLEDNFISSIRPEVFGAFLANGANQIYFAGNEINCDCSTAWLLTNSTANRVYSVFCNGRQKSLFKLSETELCGATTLTTSSTASLAVTSSNTPTKALSTASDTTNATAAHL